MKQPEVLSVKSLSTKKSAKLFHSKSCQTLKKVSNFILCIQETKLSKVTNVHLNFLDKYNLSLVLISGSKVFGGFLLWSSSLSPANQIALNASYWIVDYVELDWFVVCTNASPDCWETIVDFLKLSITILPNQLKIMKTADVIAFCFQKTNNFFFPMPKHSSIKSIKRFNQIKEQIPALVCTWENLLCLWKLWQFYLRLDYDFKKKFKTDYVLCKTLIYQSLIVRCRTFL